VQVAKKNADKPKKTNQFHTVQKGETLWSISQKYKTNVEAVRKMNNLTPEDKIHIGGKLLVR
ncbi:MAG: LysM domain-containing protein, partial [Desulfobacter sp.]